MRLRLTRGRQPLRRLPRTPHIAKVAIEVADDFQRHGIETALAYRTLVRARANGVTTLTATTLQRNVPARALLTRLGFRTRATHGAKMDMTADV